MSSLKKTLLLLALSTPAHAGVALPGGASTKEFPTCGVRISLGNGAGFHCEADPAATEHAGKKIAFACCDADMGYSTCTRKDPSGQCYAGLLSPLSNFAPKDWYEATNACAAEGKVLCGVEQPCMNKGCHYNYHYQWTGEECQAGDAGLPAACAPPPPTPAPTKQTATPAPTKHFPTCGVRINLGNGAGFHCETDPAATEHAGKKIAFACCDADMGYSTCTRADADGQCYAGFLNSVSHFAPKTYHEATNVCAAEGKVLCGVEQPCMNKGCYYNYHYQWTGEECQAGDAGLPAACVSTVQPTAAPTARPTPRPTIKPTAAPTARPTPRPTIKPTAAPTAKPTAGPTPAVQPTIKPTAAAPTGGEGVCGFMNVPVTMDECPANPDIPKNCKQAACNELCEGDGECGTRTGQNNCGPFDVYRKWCEDTPEPTPKPTPAPSPAPSPKPTSDGRGICGVANIPVGQWPHHRESCPANPDLPNCQVVQCGELCEGDGECGTFGGLNNCGPYDVYRKWCETPPIAPTASPTETPICEVSAITPADPSKFNIQLVRFGAPSAYDALFQEAADRWASFISRDLPAYGALGKDWFLGAFCGEYTGPVDDVVVGYEVGYIDGRYGVLGRAGARYISGSRPFSGIMKFDAVDMDAYDDARRKLIILHEMGHILGLVETTGSRCSNDCPNTGDTSYTCPKALAEYAALGLGPNTLRLENDGGGGTKCKHWDEDSFAVAGSSELMTGGFEAGLYQPISRMTVAALDDLGVYGPLNYDAADPYPATRRKLEEGPGFEVLTPTESFTLDGDDEYVVEVEPVPLDA